jgi:hypothetical protein
MVISYQSFGSSSNFLSTFRGYRKEITTTRCLITQKRGVLIYFGAETWNHAHLVIYATLSLSKASATDKTIVTVINNVGGGILLYFLPAVNKWKVDWVSRIKSVRNSLSLTTIVKVSFTVVKSYGWIVTISWYPRKGLIWNIQFSTKCSCSYSDLVTVLEFLKTFKSWFFNRLIWQYEKYTAERAL